VTGAITGKAEMARIDWSRFDWPSLAEGWVEDLRLAAVFFTCLPLSLEEDPAGAGIGRAIRAWPLIGLLVGLVGAVGYGIGHGLGLAPLPAALLAVAVMVAVTGAFHEDGLADLADSLGGRDPAERLAIMRDSRIGSFGVLALLLSVGLRTTALAQLATPGAVAAALVAAAAASRGLVPLLTLSLEPARRDGLGALLGIPRQEVVVTAAALGALAALLCLGLGGGIAALACGLGAALGTGTLARRRLGGYTGDVLGAAQQAAEAAILLAAAVFT
jgi:adenosylcobinamide-GDP ribazoletransferase